MSIRTVFIDMDGVTVDWLTGVTVALGKSMDIYQPYQTSSEGLSWDTPVKLLGEPAISRLMTSSENFWSSLQPFDWTAELIQKVSSRYRVVFLSKPAGIPAAAAGKLIWCNRYYPNIELILCNHKGIVASANKYLIDDDVRQTIGFANECGHTWLFDQQFKLQQKSATEMSAYLDNLLAHIRSIP